MNLIRRIRMALSDALRPEPEPAPSLVKIVAADKLQCDLSLLEALAESERWNFTVEMLQERQTRLGETLTFEIEAEKAAESRRRFPNGLPPAPEGFSTLGVGTISVKMQPRHEGFAENLKSAMSDTEGFGEPRAEPHP